MTGKILVTGASGTIGRALVSKLQQRNTAFVAGVRNPGEARNKFTVAVELVRFDFADPSTFEQATAGVDKVFVLGPPLLSNLHELLTPFIDFLKAKGILRVVYVSALGADDMAGLPFHKSMTKKIRDDGFDFTVLQPSFFAQNFINYEGDNIRQRNVLFIPAGSGKTAFIDVHDIAEVAAAVLTEEGHSGKTYELTGPELLSYEQAAEIISDILGRKITYVSPSDEEYTQVLKAAGAPDFIAPYMISVYAMIKGNHVDRLTDDVEKLTGRKPASLKTVLEREASALK